MKTNAERRTSNAEHRSGRVALRRYPFVRLALLHPPALSHGGEKEQEQRTSAHFNPPVPRFDPLEHAVRDQADRDGGEHEPTVAHAGDVCQSLADALGFARVVVTGGDDHEDADDAENDPARGVPGAAEADDPRAHLRPPAVELQLVAELHL